MELLFSVTKRDLVRQTFATSGPGGQHRNAKQNCVRFIHKASGAVGEGRVYREQYRNERDALHNLAESKEFLAWHRAECARQLGQLAVETPEQIMARVDQMIESGLRDGSIEIEVLPE